MKIVKRLVTLLMIMAVLVAFTPLLQDGEVYAASIKLNKKTVYLLKGKTYKLKVKGSKSKAKWISSDKTVVSVSKKGKLKAMGYGTATVTAKVKGKTLKCKVTVERKAQKNARKLRDYILKNGKKSGGKYYISKKRYSEAAEGSLTLIKISASKADKNLVFEWSESTTEPPEVKKCTMTIDLISGTSAVRTGTFKAVFEDGYSVGTWDEFHGEVTTEYSYPDYATYKGLKLIRFVSYLDEAVYEDQTDAAKLAEEGYVRPASYYIDKGFENWDSLIKSKKTLKKAKVTMKSMGFKDHEN